MEDCINTTNPLLNHLTGLGFLNKNYQGKFLNSPFQKNLKAGSSCWNTFYLPPKTTFTTVTPHCKTFLVTLKIKWWLRCTASVHVLLSSTHFFCMFACADEASLVVGAPSILSFRLGHKRALVWTGEAASKGSLKRPWNIVCTEGYSFMSAHTEKLAVCGFGHDCAVSINVSCVSGQQKL